MIEQLQIEVPGQGLHMITRQIQQCLMRSQIQQGLCTLLLQHTSASLIIQENADPSARADLENWLCRLVPENDPLFTHTLEGSDDMPAHIKTALTASSLSIPVINGQLALGTWQGIYLWEHRHQPARRSLVLHLLAD